jgi:hypothetical protein
MVPFQQTSERNAEGELGKEEGGLGLSILFFTENCIPLDDQPCLCCSLFLYFSLKRFPSTS